MKTQGLYVVVNGKKVGRYEGKLKKNKQVTWTIIKQDCRYAWEFTKYAYGLWREIMLEYLIRVLERLGRDSGI